MIFKFFFNYPKLRSFSPFFNSQVSENSKNPEFILKILDPSFQKFQKSRIHFKILVPSFQKFQKFWIHFLKFCTPKFPKIPDSVF